MSDVAPVRAWDGWMFCGPCSSIARSLGLRFMEDPAILQEGEKCGRCGTVVLAEAPNGRLMKTAAKTLEETATCLFEEESLAITGNLWVWADAGDEVRNKFRLRAYRQALDEAGLQIVPKEPDETMWGGLARAIVMWTHFDDHTGNTLYEHLRMSGIKAPDWLKKEIPHTTHVPPKGTVAACIYKAALAAAPKDVTL